MIDLSYSQLRDFKRCPRLYQRKHVEDRSGDEDPKRSFIGTVLGKLVEQFYVERWWRVPGMIGATMQQAATVLTRQVTDADGIHWETAEKLAAEKKISEAIPIILQVIKQEKLLSPEVYTEHETVLDYRDISPRDTVRIHGRPDLVLVRKQQLTVLDAKAGATVGRYVDRDQVRQYALAIWRSAMFGRVPDRVGFWWLRHGTIVWLPVPEKTLRVFEERLKEIARQVLASDYAPTPGTWCRSCAFRLGCPEGKAYGMTKGSKLAIDVAANLGTISL